MDIIPLNNNSHSTHRQIHNITDGEDLFHPQQVILIFPDVMTGLDYMVRAHLLNSEGIIIGPEFQTIISVVPFGMLYCIIAKIVSLLLTYGLMLAIYIHTGNTAEPTQAATSIGKKLLCYSTHASLNTSLKCGHFDNQNNNLLVHTNYIVHLHIFTENV